MRHYNCDYMAFVAPGDEPFPEGDDICSRCKLMIDGEFIELYPDQHVPDPTGTPWGYAFRYHAECVGFDSVADYDEYICEIEQEFDDEWIDEEDDDE